MAKKAVTKPEETTKAPETPEVIGEIANVETIPSNVEQFDPTVEPNHFDKKEEEKAAHAKPEKVSEAVKHAIQNPNGIGNEWPRG